MSLFWTIDSAFRFVGVLAQGDVVRADVEQLLDAMASQEAMGYRKLFDALEGDTSMGPEDLLALGIRMRSFHGKAPMGPLALVLPDDKAHIIMPVLGMLASADRPMKIFADHKKARHWLTSLGGPLPPPVRSSATAARSRPAPPDPSRP